jgi:hypothetical protein
VDRVFIFALTAAMYPTLLAAVAIMIELDNPKRLLTGYLAGAWLTSMVCGVLLVFTLNGSSVADTSKHTVDPILNIALGFILLVVVIVVATGHDARRRAWSERRAEKAKEKAEDRQEPRWRRQLSKGSARSTFAAGALLSFPGGSQIAGMSALADQHLATAATVALIVVFNAIMLALGEIPLLGYVVKPEATAATVERFNAWLARSGGRVALVVGGVFGLLFILRGIVNW